MRAEPRSLVVLTAVNIACADSEIGMFRTSSVAYAVEGNGFGGNALTAYYSGHDVLPIVRLASTIVRRALLGS